MSSLLLKLTVVFFTINLVSCNLFANQRPLKAKLQRKALATKLLMRKTLAKMLLAKPCHILKPKVIFFLKPYLKLAEQVVQLVNDKCPRKTPSSPQDDRFARYRAGLAIRKQGISPFQNSARDLTNAGDGFVGEVREDSPPSANGPMVGEVGPRNFLSRAFRSFANHDEYTLDEVSPMLKPVHHLLRNTGRAMLPPPPDQDAAAEPSKPLYIDNLPMTQ
ncbi:uncharacterized protein LOC135935948 [Cloeon dipterum]|uniref:uncharacterized protein LOC135935948 n=1 Tax=Cloeon dipterum TaxID=197152 RepID=UPI00322082C0